MELIFEIRDAEEAGYCPRALGHGIFTQAETWEELRANVLEAVSLHFEDGAEPSSNGATALRERPCERLLYRYTDVIIEFREGKVADVRRVALMQFSMVENQPTPPSRHNI